MGLAVASSYRSTTALTPAALVPQWRYVATRVGVAIDLMSHEALSRGRQPIPSDLLIVDEAHHFRNPETRRYDVLARAAGASDLLLISATPVVNDGRDLVSLLRLFAPDHLFVPFGLNSLEGALAGNASRSVTWAVAPAVVARSAASIPNLSDLLPRLKNRRVLRPPPVPHRALRQILAAVDALEFPGIVESCSAALLRMHLLHRLASSGAACRETVRRHLAYADRAIHAAHIGRPLDRSAARRIFSSDEELQLDLDDVSAPGPVPAIRRKHLQRERQRLARLLQRLPTNGRPGPKARALLGLLRERAGKRTIVFTSAVATAFELARALAWHRVAVVGAGKAWIASGGLPVEEALSLFAPRARGASTPGQATRVTTLIATDIASEGLDLQDADAVVHYDLPWTPLRLEQRVGRIVRLGSEHASTEVCWFAPAQSIEDRLQMEARIAAKVSHQLRLGVAETSRIGEARIINDLLTAREHLGGGLSDPLVHTPRHAVVSGPLAAAIALLWNLGDALVPELLIVRGRLAQLEYDYEAASLVLQDLLSGDPVDVDPPSTLLGGLISTTRARLAAADMGPVDPGSRRLARAIIQIARAAGRSRNARLLRLLDATLDVVRMGLPVGPQRSLEAVLSRAVTCEGLTDWLRWLSPNRGRRAIGFRVVAAIFGDGTLGGE